MKPGGGRVGLVTTSFPRHAEDSAGVFVADRVDELLAGGREVDVVAAGEPGDDGAPVAFSTAGGTATVWRIPSPVSPGGVSLFYGMGAPEVFEARARRDPWVWASAVHFGATLTATVRRLATARAWRELEAHWLVPSAIAARLAVPSLPRRGWSHAGDVALLERLAGHGGRTLARWLAREASELVFVSRDLQTRFARLAGAEVGTVADLPLPPTLFHLASAAERAQAKAHLAVDGPCIVTVARLVPIKGIDVLLEACGQLSPGCHLVVIGEGPTRPALEARAQSLGLDARFLGHLPRREVARWLAAADAYVQPSRPLASGRTEGMPIAVREALAVGVPVIASRTGGLAEIGARVTLVPPDDPSELARSITRALRQTGYP